VFKPLQTHAQEGASRKVVVYSLMSLDGVAEEPGDWMFDVDAEVFDFLGSVIQRQNDILLGRATYDYWVGFWPTSEMAPFAGFVNTTTKHVFSSTELTQPWRASKRADAPLVEYVEALKQAEGADIGVHGSATLVQALLAEDLVDELHLVVVPTIAGRGARLFPADGRGPYRFACTHHSVAQSGTVFLSYERVRGERVEATDSAHCEIG
jgi:dihydrofolate reductase